MLLAHVPVFPRRPRPFGDQRSRVDDGTLEQTNVRVFLQERPDRPNLTGRGSTGESANAYSSWGRGGGGNRARFTRSQNVSGKTKNITPGRFDLQANLLSVHLILNRIRFISCRVSVRRRNEFSGQFGHTTRSFLFLKNKRFFLEQRGCKKQFEWS